VEGTDDYPNPHRRLIDIESVIYEGVPGALSKRVSFQNKSG